MFQLFQRVFIAISLLAIVSTLVLFRSRISAHADALATATWAGYEVRGARGTYTEVDSSFTVPSLARIAHTSVAIWAGVGSRIGTIKPRELVQAGVVSSIDSTKSAQVNRAFWEIYGDGKSNSEQYFPPSVLSVHTGDHIEVYVTSNVNNNGQDYFLITDTTTKKSALEVFNSPNAIADGAAADCITEAHLSTSTLLPKPLANFGTVKFTSCSAYNKNKPEQRCIPISQGQYNKLDMIRDSTLIASTSALLPGKKPGDGNLFTITWHNRGKAIPVLPTPTPVRSHPTPVRSHPTPIPVLPTPIPVLPTLIPVLPTPIPILPTPITVKRLA
jgi:hypothetical protein